MCLIYIAHRVHPAYPLVVAANRDEFHDRASSPAHWWQQHPQILAGQDQVAGGTWLGVTRSGRFAALTNYRSARAYDQAARSRGELTRDFLLDDSGAFEYAQSVAACGDRYNGFSLLVHDGRELAVVSNRSGEPERVAPGVHGLSNELLNTPWPKVEEGKLDLLGLLARDALGPADLLALLDHRETAHDNELPDTGVSIERERAYSARFILGERYGTRCATLLCVAASGDVRFQERQFDAKGHADGDRVFEFTIEPNVGSHWTTSDAPP